MDDPGRWLGLLVAYLVGSVPFAWLAGQLLEGIDLRQHGSGNLGATNVLRTLGVPAAVIVLALDALKGAIPVLFFREWFGGAPGIWWPAAFGVAAIAGHVRPFFGSFRGGGKGVATAAGVFAALSPLAMLVAFGTFVVLVSLTRIVSVGSMGAGAALVLASVVAYGLAAQRTWLAAAVALFVVFTHRANIGRLRRGEEPRVGRKSAAGAR